jgi:hypothetical protein
MTLELPGNSDLSSYTKYIPVISKLDIVGDRPVIILATNDVNDDTLFRNGLTQNIVILYDLFESMGYKSYLLQYSGGDVTAKKPFILNYRTLVAGDIIKNPMPIKLFIEIGMSLDSVTRAYLRSIGAKIVKLYLGNILNIDIETIQNFHSIFFNHHVVGEIDEIWTSPHYKQHIDYATVLNRCDISKGKVVPYVWDPCFVTQYGSRDVIDWAPVADWRKQDIVIMDPNISFQKCYFYSLLLVEAFAKKHPEWQGKVQIINGDRIQIDANSNNFILPSLALFRDKRIVLHRRKNFHTILKDHRSSCFITHQWNNDFNYMSLELLYCNYPILHNSEGWNNYGYYYDINNWSKAIETLYNALVYHKDNLNIYRTHAANLMWKHSIHNPEIQAEWRCFLE